jgi:hypothetical protein
MANVLKLGGIYQHIEFKIKMRLVLADIEHDRYKMVSKWPQEGFVWEGNRDYLDVRFEFLQDEQ